MLLLLLVLLQLIQPQLLLPPLAQHFAGTKSINVSPINDTNQRPDELLEQRNSIAKHTHIHTHTLLHTLAPRLALN